MIYIMPTSGKYQGAFVAGSLRGGKGRLKAVSLEVTSKSSWVTCGHKQRVVRCSKFLAWQKHGMAHYPKLNDDDEDNGLKEFGTIRHCSHLIRQ